MQPAARPGASYQGSMHAAENIAASAATKVDSVGQRAVAQVAAVRDDALRASARQMKAIQRATQTMTKTRARMRTILVAHTRIKSKTGAIQG